MQFVNWLKQRHLVIDWHNYGTSMVSKRLGERSILTRLVDKYERFWGYKATIHICVSRAMARQLLYTYEKKGKVTTLYDRAPEGFRQLNVDEIHSVSSIRMAPSLVYSPTLYARFVMSSNVLIWASFLTIIASWQTEAGETGPRTVIEQQVLAYNQRRPNTFNNKEFSQRTSNVPT